MAALSELSPRERQVCDGIHAGKTNQMIADDLGLTTNTIKQYVRLAFKRIGVKRRSEMALMVERERAATK